MKPVALDLLPTNLIVSNQPHPAYAREPLGTIGQKKGNYLSLNATSLNDASDADKGIQSLLNDLQDKALVELHAGRSQQSSNRPCSSALFADHFPQIRLRYSQFQNHGLLSIDLRHADQIGLIDQGFRNILNKFLHSASYVISIGRPIAGSIVRLYRSLPLKQTDLREKT
jgi:hypothetical protein